MVRKFNVLEKLLIAATLILLATVFFGGRSLPEVSAKERFSSDDFEDLKLFTDVLALVRRDYVREVEVREVIQGAIKGMLASLDPHSGYLDPEFYKDLKVQTRGEFGGLGIEITVRDGLLVVVAPMEGTPAARAGIQPGDAIIKIDGKFTKEFSLVDAVHRLRGPKGTPITLSIHRNGQKKLTDVTLIRDKITVNSVRSRYLEDGFGYVRISQFMEKTHSDVKAALKRMEREAGGQLRGVILDVRNNPGGLLAQAVKISDMFLHEGVIVYTEGRVLDQKQRFFAKDRGTEADYPIIVLVNGGSASASEIVAGAIKDHGRGLVLGTQTFGKGSVQTITPLKNGGAVTLTTALYYTKSGNSIQAKGVTPDINVEMEEPVLMKVDKSKQKRQKVREIDLPGVLRSPEESQEEDPIRKLNEVPTEDEEIVRINPETANLEDWLGSDVQLSRALDLLKSYDVFKTVKSVKTAPSQK